MWQMATLICLLVASFPILYWFRGAHPWHPRPSRRFRGERVPFRVAIEKDLDRVREIRRDQAKLRNRR